MKKAKHSNRKIWIGLGLVLFLGLLLRLNGVAWDGGFYLNPDERFLTMTATGLKWPSTLAGYFNPQISTLNPYNNNVHFFVYGHFPLILAKLFAIIFGKDDYSHFFQVARPLTALMDTSVILAVFLMAKKLFAKHKDNLNIALFSALAYVLMVFPLQQAHFFTCDSFVNAFFVWSLCFLIIVKKDFHAVFWAAVFFGLGLASKISILYSLPLLLLILYFRQPAKKSFCLQGIIFALVSYFTLRLADPYLFANSNFFNPLFDPQYLQNLKDLNNLGKNIFYPPGVQWLNTNWTLPLKNMVLYGLGPALSILVLIGLFQLWHKRQKNSWFSRRCWLAILIWMTLFFVYQSLQLSKTMRYYLFLYPLFGLLIGLAIARLNRLIRFILVLPALLWLLAFTNIYTVPHSRIAASNWINANLPKKSIILTEYWDDPLPLYHKSGKEFRTIQLDIYQPDSRQKWQRLAKILSRADYLILSSNRLWGSIPRVPEKYPIASRYYQLLLGEKLGYRLAARFTVFPNLKIGPLNLEIDDTGAEEAFTVYDHPQVLIFQRRNFNYSDFLKKIGL